MTAVRVHFFAPERGLYVFVRPHTWRAWIALFFRPGYKLHRIITGARCFMRHVPRA